MKILNNYKYILEDIIFGSKILGSVIVIFCLLTSIIMRLGSISDYVSIEQLRSDSKLVNLQNSEDVIGQITQYNQRIVKFQKYNKIWLFDLLIPDKWDEIKTIEIPKN
mgnify:CR=1 FL=1